MSTFYISEMNYISDQKICKSVIGRPNNSNVDYYLAFTTALKSLYVMYSHYVDDFVIIRVCGMWIHLAVSHENYRPHVKNKLCTSITGQVHGQLD